MSAPLSRMSRDDDRSCSSDRRWSDRGLVTPYLGVKHFVSNHNEPTMGNDGFYWIRQHEASVRISPQPNSWWPRIQTTGRWKLFSVKHALMHRTLDNGAIEKRHLAPLRHAYSTWLVMGPWFPKIKPNQFGPPLHRSFLMAAISMGKNHILSTHQDLLLPTTTTSVPLPSCLNQTWTFLPTHLDIEIPNIRNVEMSYDYYRNAYPGWGTSEVSKLSSDSNLCFFLYPELGVVVSTGNTSSPAFPTSSSL